MKTIFKIMIFSIMLNFSVGIMFNVIPAFDISMSGGLEYDPGYADSFQSGLNSSVVPQGGLEDKGNSIYRVLDMMNIGFLGRMISTVDKYMFGFIKMMESMIGGVMTDSLRNMIFGTLRVLMTIGYIVGAWWLWTGKDMT